ncbi:MAG: ribosomal RNA small subunit methyltransferase A [Planctomycetes bacterium]|nr:ribosomal RNA small subunit methyltransferase A [Planctomycetota bacterium]
MNDVRDDAPHSPTHGELRALLEARGIHPMRRHGQNFLLDENLLAAIVRDACVVPGDHVLEIGCGPGLLTRHLVRAGAIVLAVDVDERMIPIARELVGDTDRVAFLLTDALAGKHELAPELLERLRGFERYRLVANLPYAVATPLLLGLATHEHPPFEMVTLVQREAADRYAAGPGRKAYGSASVRLQVRYVVDRLRHVPPTVFWPRPKVDSAVVRFQRRNELPEPRLLRVFDRLVDTAFGQRRKRVARNLKALDGSVDWMAWLERLGVPAEVRAEDLSVASFLDLARDLLDRSERCQAPGGQHDVPGTRC